MTHWDRHHRYPVQPLLDKLRMSPTQFAKQYKADYRTLKRPSGIIEETADRWAVMCGYHPAEIWPEWVDNGMDDTAHRFVDLWAETDG